MGRGWRRVTEAVRQTLAPVTDKNFQITSNARNEAMFREAQDFSVHIKTMERDLLALEKQVAGQFANLRDILVTPLPRVYDYAENGSLAAKGLDATIGQNINVDRLAEATATMKDKVEKEVFQPMREWMRDFKRVQSEMKKLEAMRLEVDSRRRTVGGLDKALTDVKEKSMRRAATMRNGNGAPLVYGAPQQEMVDPADAKLARQIEETGNKKVHKEEKLRETQTNFNELEVVVFNSLDLLIVDAASLREYAASALNHVQECFAYAFAAFEAPAAVQCSSSAQPAMFALPAPASNPSPAVSADKAAGKSMLRAFATKLTGGSATNYPPPSSPRPARDNDGRFDQAPPTSTNAFDAAPAGKIMPPSHEADVGQHHYAAARPAYAAQPSPRYPYAAY